MASYVTNVTNGNVHSKSCIRIASKTGIRSSSYWREKKRGVASRCCSNKNVVGCNQIGDRSLRPRYPLSSLQPHQIVRLTIEHPSQISIWGDVTAAAGWYWSDFDAIWNTAKKKRGICLRQIRIQTPDRGRGSTFDSGGNRMHWESPAELAGGLQLVAKIVWLPAPSTCLNNGNGPRY